MSRKLSDNGRWESSRLMLPQHKEMIINYNTRLTRQTKPLIMGDEWEEFSRKLGSSLHHKTLVTIEVFDEYHNRLETGIVRAVLEYSKKLKLELENGFEWIDFDKIVGVQGGENDGYVEC